MKASSWLHAGLLVFGSLALAGSPSAQDFERAEQDVFPGDGISTALQGVSPGAEVELIVVRAAPWAGNVALRATATFRAGADGRVDPTTLAPVSGSYIGIDASGLFWSMVPSPGTEIDVPADTIRLQAKVSGSVVASGTRRLHSVPPGVEWTDVERFPGARLYRPARSDANPRPAIIVLGGSEGGASTANLVAPRLAAQGYAVLGLPYYSPDYGAGQEVPGLPSRFVGIPVDRLQDAHDWLVEQDGVDPKRIGLWGVSKGAEFALIAASRFAWICAVAAIVPSDVVWEGFVADAGAEDTLSSFSWHGESLAWMPYDGMREAVFRIGRGEDPRFRAVHDRGRAANPHRLESARIPIERFRGRLFLAGATDDEVYDSAGMARNIARSRSAAGLDTELLVFEDAGHGIVGDGWSPGSSYAKGSPQKTAAAQRALWSATLDFFNRAFGQD